MKRGLRLLVAVLLCGAATACAHDGSSPNISLPAKDVDHWAMPLDAYILPAQSQVPRDAWLIKMTSCLRDAGFDAPQVPSGFEQPDDPTRNAVGYHLDTMDVATKYGFHDGTELPGGVVEDPGDVMSDRLESWGDAGQKAFESCSSEYDSLLVDAGDDADENSADWLSIQAEDVALKNSEVKSAAHKWYDCMKPNGYPGLKKSPREFPSDALLAEVGHADEGDVVPTASLPTEDEIAVAETNVKCLNSSGYLKELYDAEWSEETKLLEANYAHLEDKKNKQEVAVARAQKIVNEHE
jgi:hypothetical protein